MQIYLKPIISACYVFPVLALLFTIPYILYEYHKYGSILVLRTGIIYTFIFYMLTSYFMTILPLPPLDSVSSDSACMLLVPFDAVKRVIVNSHINFKSPATYINIFSCADFWQIIFNILLLLPFGVYLRYYFRRKWWQVLIMSFVYSLFFELTQLSGLYGIYRYPYRFFEVDDLICNTLGGMTGYLITPLFVFFIPKREKLDEIAYSRGEIVSEFRRIVAWVIDIALIIAPVVAFFVFNKEIIINIIYDSRYIMCISAYVTIVFTVVTAASKGRTVGKALVNIRLVNGTNENIMADRTNFKEAGIFRLFFRYIILYMIELPSLIYAYGLYKLTETAIGWEYVFYGIGCGIFIIIAAYFVVDLVLCLFSDTRNMIYDRITGITHMNMVKK